MHIEGLVQAPFCTTMMGVMRGALNYYGANVSDAFLFGASGHAFVLNIHKELCPSGPYVWDRRRVEQLLANLGIRPVSLGFFHAGSSTAERASAEQAIRSALDEGTPCSLLNMEHQLITGYDDEGLFTAQPWPEMDYPPARLTYGAWQELGSEIHMELTILDECQPADRTEAVLGSLRYAVEVWRALPGADDAYAMGSAAYDWWIEAVQNGHGAHHGAWWNAMVWSECRSQAGAYFREIEEMLPSASQARTLSAGYKEIGELLRRCAPSEVPVQDKVEHLAWARDLEESCIQRIEALLEKM